MTGKRLRDRRWAPRGPEPSGSRAPTARLPRTSIPERGREAFGHPLPTEDVVAGRFGDGGHFGNQVIGHLQFLERCPEILDHGIEMRIIKSLLDQVRMSFSHVQAGVVIWAAESHGQETFLLGRLFGHIHARKEPADAVVLEHFAVENIHCGIDGGCTAQILIQSHSSVPQLIEWSITSSAARDEYKTHVEA